MSTVHHRSNVRCDLTTRLASPSLLWSKRGEVACAEHASQTDDPRWTIEGWAPIPVAAGHIKRQRYQCQPCAIGGRAFVRSEHPQPDVDLLERDAAVGGG